MRESAQLGRRFASDANLAELFSQFRLLLAGNGQIVEPNLGKCALMQKTFDNQTLIGGRFAPKIPD
jgi:hypothetical protein